MKMLWKAMHSDVDVKKTFCLLACNRTDKSPFSEAAVRRARGEWRDIRVAESGQKVSGTAPAGQPLSLELVEAQLKASGDLPAEEEHAVMHAASDISWDSTLFEEALRT